MSVFSRNINQLKDLVDEVNEWLGAYGGTPVSLQGMVAGDTASIFICGSDSTPSSCSYRLHIKSGKPSHPRDLGKAVTAELKKGLVPVAQVLLSMRDTIVSLTLCREAASGSEPSITAGSSAANLEPDDDEVVPWAPEYALRR